MLTNIQNTITAALTGLELFKDVGFWQGDLGEVIKNPARLPAAWVLFTGLQFTEPYTRPTVIPPCYVSFTVVLVARNLAGPNRTAESYDQIDSVCAALSGLETEYGSLWPGAVELSSVEHGITVYSVHVGCEYYK